MRVPVSQPTWEYDDDSRTLIGTFVEVAAVDHPDPANFSPTVGFEIAIPLPKKATEFIIGE